MRSYAVDIHHSPQGKPDESGADTRHGTSNKKPIESRRLQSQLRNPYLVPDRINEQLNPRRSRYHSFVDQVQMLKEQKHNLLRMKRYRAAERTDQQLKRAMSTLAHSQYKILKTSHSQERKELSQCHRNFIKHFKGVWSEYFQKLQEKQKLLFINFKNEQERDMEKAKYKLIRKCKSLKTNSSEINYLNKKQQILLKEGRFRELSELKIQKKKAINKIQRQRELTVAKWTQVQQKNLTASHTKKYNSLVAKIEQSRADKEKAYMREQKRLKQKYKNVIRQLQHEHRMDINMFKQRFDYQ